MRGDDPLTQFARSSSAFTSREPVRHGVLHAELQKLVSAQADVGKLRGKPQREARAAPGQLARSFDCSELLLELATSPRALIHFSSELPI